MRCTKLLKQIPGLKAKLKVTCVFRGRAGERARAFQLSRLFMCLAVKEKHLCPNLIWDVSFSLVATTGWNYCNDSDCKRVDTYHQSPTQAKSPKLTLRTGMRCDRQTHNAGIV